MVSYCNYKTIKVHIHFIDHRLVETPPVSLTLILSHFHIHLLYPSQFELCCVPQVYLVHYCFQIFALPFSSSWNALPAGACTVALPVCLEISQNILSPLQEGPSWRLKGNWLPPPHTVSIILLFFSIFSGQYLFLKSCYLFSVLMAVYSHQMYPSREQWLYLSH